jgi:hypothetical protein
MPLLNNAGNYIIVGGPRDGESIQLPPGKRTLEVVLLNPAMNAAGPNDPVPTTNVRYVAKTVLVGTSWVDVLAPDFYNDQEVLTALVLNYRPKS